MAWTWSFPPLFVVTMNEDPFARFERSRGGLLIPVLLFMAGAVPTVLAARSMAELVVLEEAEEPPENQDPVAAPAAEQPTSAASADESDEPFEGPDSGSAANDE